MKSRAIELNYPFPLWTSRLITRTGVISLAKALSVPRPSNPPWLVPKRDPQFRFS